MTQTPDPAEIAGLLHTTGIAPGIVADDLSVLSTKGISHDHWRIGSTGLVLRIPRLNQWGMEAQEALTYQQSAFQRAALSGYAPNCVDTLPPSLAMPRGALIVEEVIGRAPQLPDELGVIADTLAALHSNPMPSENALAPLQIHHNPVSSTLHVIEEQAVYLTRAQLDRQADTDIRAELEWARDFASKGEPDFALCFVGTDTHPGNFLIDEGGKAWFVDLEKSVYGAAPIDLAHATLSTSTGWDPDCAVQLSHDEVAKFYRRYLRSVGPDRADELEPWLLPLRRLTWLRTITWFARWQAQWSKQNHAAARDTTMTEHVRAHIERSFRPDSISASRQEWLVPQVLGF